MGMLEDLNALGADIDEINERFLGDFGLYKRVLKKFIGSAKQFEVMPHFERGDNDQAMHCAHTMKGVTGNLALTPLYKGYCEITDLIKADKPDEARRVLEELLPVQEKFIECIKKYS